MSEDELNDLAYGIVMDHLAEGPEYLTFSEVLSDNVDEYTDSDVEKLAILTREWLAKAMKGL